MDVFKIVAIRALNHVIASESWAGERLRQHAGRRLMLDTPLLRLQLAVDERGLFSLSDSTESPDVTLSIPGSALMQAAVDRDRLFASVRLDGVADVAEALAFVFRNLRWDAEADLAQLVGDIVAHRMVQLGRGLARGLQNSARNLAENLSEYAAEESGLVVGKPEIDAFGNAVNRLRDDTARLEKRIARL